MAEKTPTQQSATKPTPTQQSVTKPPVKYLPIDRLKDWARANDPFSSPEQREFHKKLAETKQRLLDEQEEKHLRWAKGGSVRGTGCAKRGVKKCKVM